MNAAIVECLRVLRAHRDRLVLVALVTAFAVLLVWVSSPRPIEDDDASLAVVAQNVRSEPPPDSLITESSEPALPDPSQVAGAGALEKVQVCGVGWVDADADGAVDTQAIRASAPMAEASARLLESIRLDGDFGGAVALALQLRSRGDGALPLQSIQAACAAGPCDATNDDRAAAASLIDRIVRLAATTNDPHAYSLALEICASQPGEGPCTALSAAQWARLDPDNGAPWLHLLAQAFSRRDESAVDEALFHIGAATRLDRYVLDAERLVTKHAGSTPADVLMAGDLSMSVAVLRPVGTYDGIDAASRSCASGTLSDSNRKELCEKVAAALQERSTTLMDMRIGSAMGRRLGWADERFEAADALFAAAPDAFTLVPTPSRESRPMASLRQSSDCASIVKVLRHFAEVATLGEREHTRRWIERTGRAGDYVQLGRAQHARTVAREAAQAAERASAPGR